MSEQHKIEENREIQDSRLKHILEAALLAAGEPLSPAQMSALFEENGGPSNSEINEALATLARDCEDRGIELTQVASGYRLQVKPVLQTWVARLWTEKPQRYSRALLETVSLIAYRQPITRGEIEAVRGVSVRSSIIRTLQEREWIRIVGHRDVPGKPALFGTTREFLDYFNLKSLDELPTLAEIKDMENLEPELDLDAKSASAALDAGKALEDDAAPESTKEAEIGTEETEEISNHLASDAGDDALEEAFAEVDALEDVSIDDLVNAGDAEVSEEAEVLEEAEEDDTPPENDDTENPDSTDTDTRTA